MSDTFATVEEALDEIRAGRILIVTDDEDRENEGDFVMAAGKTGPEAVNFMVSRGRGLVCQAISAARARELELGPMAPENTSAHATAFTVSVDAAGLTSTGISAFDRAATIGAIVDPATRPADLLRPGHIFPLVARDGGVLARRGHTEAAVDLAALAGLAPSGVLCEILNDDGSMARLPRLEEIARETGLKIITVEALVRYRQTSPAPVDSTRRLAESRLPTAHGGFRMIMYENAGSPDQPHFALVSERPFDRANALVRIHSECLTGETLGSRRCDCGDQLRAAQRRLARQGGVLIYLRQEGRGIGLTNKIRAYSLQEDGLDTIEANLRLGFKADQRDFSPAAAMLRDLGISGVRLLTNNPEKLAALSKAGLRVIERIGLEIRPNRTNRGYLAAKKAGFGHILEFV